jgi:hypothetical protein
MKRTESQYFVMPSYLLFVLFLVLNSYNTFSQPAFTKITSANNPAVNDTAESTGVSWVDFNNDGYLDLFVSNGNIVSQNNFLYLNDRSGSFIKITTGAVVNDGGTSIGGTWGDLNNDGNLDLYVTNRNNFGNFLYLGNGDTTFTKVTTGSIVTDQLNGNSSGWVDINRDGYLDIMTVNFTQNDILHLGNGSPSYTFTKIDTAAFLMDAGNFSIIGQWADYNNDRLPDFFVGNAGTQNDFVYRNNGNLTCAKITLNDARATLGASWGDFNNDGNLDLFTSGYLNQKCRLYVNSGAPNYDLIPIDTGIVSNDPANSVGSCWGDFDNDGDLDLFIANDGTNSGFLYMNNGAPDYSFTKVTTGTITANIANSFGCACGDYDNDGQLDIYTANRLNQKNFLFRNNGNSNHWITIICSGVVSNRAAIGAKVRVKAVINGVSRWQVREVTPQTGYNSQNLWLHFGLGDAAVIDSIKVEWINGLTHFFTNVPHDRRITINESGVINAINQNGGTIPEKFTLHQNYPNPFNPVTNIRFGIPQAGFIKMTVYDILGREITSLVNKQMHAGSYSIDWNAASYRSGIYFYQIKAGDFSETKKMILVK